MDFARDGAKRFPGALDAPATEMLRGAADLAIADGPGARMIADPAVASLLSEGPPAGIARRLIGTGAKPVRAVFFDKTAQANWAVAWHQDRVIVVRERRETPGFGPWSKKRGLIHVTPPADVLGGMTTLRLHLDPCGPDNAPLIAALGSHRAGYVAASEAAGRAGEMPQELCFAEAGDIWAYATPILHASARAAAPARRRVLQVDYAAGHLPGGLQWRGIAAC